MRKLGIPTVLDRFIQQAVLQVLQPIFDPGFSEHSHGFRPRRRAHDAVVEAQRYELGAVFPGNRIRRTRVLARPGRGPTSTLDC